MKIILQHDSNAFYKRLSYISRRFANHLARTLTPYINEGDWSPNYSSKFKVGDGKFLKGCQFSGLIQAAKAVQLLSVSKNNFLQASLYGYIF